MAFKTLFAICLLVAGATAQPSATEVFTDIYSTCLKDYSISCVQPKAMAWFNQVASDDVIRITEDLTIVKDPEVPAEEQRAEQDVFDRFDNFISTHRLVAKLPESLRPGGEFNELVPRSFGFDDADVPLGARGKSKFIKKVMIPFLVGLKFKSAVLVPLALALIALKTWKAMTLGLLSLVLSGAMLIFKLTKNKIVNYEVVHYPHHHHDHHDHHLDHHFDHHDHHVDHHVEHADAGWGHAGYGRELTGDQLAYRAHKV